MGRYPVPGNGAAGQPKQIVLFFTGHVSNVVAADFNRDGKMDIAYLSLTDQNRVTVQLGDGNGTFQAPKVVTSAGFTTLFTTYAIGDFNNDGILDFAVEEFGLIDVLLGDGHGNFTSTGSFFEGIGSNFPFVPSLVLADFNGDGFLDVAAPDGFGETTSLLLGNGDGTLLPAQLFAGGLADSAVALDVAGFQPGIAMATRDAKVRIVKNATPAK
jgi:VCBS repeat protein